MLDKEEQINHLVEVKEDTIKHFDEHYVKSPMLECWKRYCCKMIENKIAELKDQKDDKDDNTKDKIHSNV